MECWFALELEKALEESSNPDRQIAEQAESFFFDQYLNDPKLYELLFKISSNQYAKNNLNLKAVIILKKIIDKFFSKLTSQIQNLYVNYILTHSIEQQNHQILQIQMQILKQTLQVFEKDEDQKLFTIKIKELFQTTDFNAEKYYALLLMVQVYLNEHQHSNKEDRLITDYFISEIFPLLNNLITQLSNADNMTILAMYSHILSKIFFRAFRYNPTSVILQTEYYNVWFNLFSFILKQQQSEFLKAKKWITRSLLVFYRQKKNQKKENLQGVFWNDWENKYSDEFFVIMLEQVYYLKNLPEFYKIISNISRSFLFYLNSNIIAKHHDKILLTIQQNMFQLLEYNQNQKDLFYDNPVEFLKQNIWNFSDEDTRDSITFMFQIFFKNGMHEQIKQLLQERLSTPNNIESNLFLVQKLTKEMEEAFTKEQNIQFYQQLIEQIVIPNLQNKDDFVRMRCCAIVEAVYTKIQNLDLLKKLTEIICNCLQDNQMPIKSFAAITLGSLMKLNLVKQMMKPHLEELLKIYIDLIKKCDNESLINSFTKIIYQYQDSIGSYAVDLVQQFLEILINIFEKVQNKLEEVESQYFSQLETFQAIKLLLKTNFNQQQLVKTFEMVDLVFQKLMSNKMLNQGLESMIEIFQELIQKNQTGQFYQPFWKYFEFFSRSIINPPSKDQYQNQLLHYINSIEQELDLTPIFRLFVYHDKNTLLNNSDEFGVPYIDILLQCVLKLENVMCEPALGMVAPIKQLKTDLIWLLKDTNHTSVQNYIEQTLQSNIQNIQKQLQVEQDIVDQQVNWRNFGISMYFYPQQVQQLLQNNQPNNLVQIWKECNYHLMTSTMRLGSYLGLLQLFRLINVPQDDIQFVEFVILELVFINYLKEQENIIDLDFMLNQSGQDDQDDDMIITKPEKLSTMKSMKQLHKYFEENFIMECEECYVDTEGMKCYLENQNLKQLVLQVYPDLTNTQTFRNFYDQLEPEIKTKIKGIYEQDFESRLGFTFLLKQIGFVLSYFLFSRLFLNFVAKKIFKSDFVFTWRFENFIK